MITPTNITNYNRTQAELEEFLMFAIIVAGKTAKTQAEKLNQFLASAKVCEISPFEWIEKLIARSHDCGLMDCMKHYKLGQYNRLDKAFKGILQFKGKLDSVTLDELESIEGIGPKDIGMQKLIERASDGVVQEIILATNFTAEGEATAHVLSDVFKRKGLAVTRLARGVPVGSELEYVDLGTIAHALVDRRST